MDLPDGPPGAEGYQDSVVEIPKKTVHENATSKVEQEFLEYVSRLQITAENNTQRPMVERLSRHSSGYLIYLCYPCGAVCVGENVMQTHLIGKKHKTKLESKSLWPLSIFDKNQYLQNDGDSGFIKKVKPKEVDDEIDMKYKKYKNTTCVIQPAVDDIVVPLVGVEYMIEFPPDIEMRECRYYCALCAKSGQPKTILNHISSYWHRCAYMKRHFQSAFHLLSPYIYKVAYRYGVRDVVDRLAKCVDDTYGRMKPLQIDETEFNLDKDRICQWINKSYHYSEHDGKTFEEVIDKDLIATHLITNYQEDKTEKRNAQGSTTGTGRAMSTEPVSEESGDEHNKNSHNIVHKTKSSRYEPYKNRPPAVRTPVSHAESKFEKKVAAKLEHKRALTQTMITKAEENAKKTLVYHEKNPEKHPLYPEEWKKFWNKRYKELQSEGLDAANYDYKPEWIVFWTARMKELHDDELQKSRKEIYRRMCVSPPKDIEEQSHESKVKSPDRRRSPESRRSLGRRRSPDRRRPSYHHRRSPDYRRRSPPRGSYHKRPWEQHRKSPTRELRTRSRSSSRRRRTRSPTRYRPSPSPKHRSRSPLSRREGATRNLSPDSFKNKPPSLQTVIISDEELPADKFSSWKSDSGESLGSLPDAKSPVYKGGRTGSCSSRNSKNRAPVVAPEDLGAADNVVATLRILVALEDYLGSLGPKVVDLLTEALKMEKERANSSEELLGRDSCLTLLETVKEKLKGASQAGLVSAGAVAAVRTAVVRTAALLHEADRRAVTNKPDKTITPTASKTSLPVAGVGSIDKVEIAQQIAAALVAQGKTDVSSEELAALVDAVVGMAEEKKRTSELKKEPPVVAVQATTRVLQSNTDSPNKQASALQLLQTAYDEYDKKIVTEEVSPAHPMNDLSDGDLETLLKNFNELSAEEQHSLIGYLKKLETQDPRRVERLRDYVDTAAPPSEPASTVPAAPVDTPRAPTPVKNPSPPPPPIVYIESDDDDYNVEEVFKSATQKVREDQMRQELEIVKKSLQEAKVTLNSSAPVIDLDKESMKAIDLLAIVQASVQPLTTNRQVTTAPTVVVSGNTAPSVVDTDVMPKSHGDSFQATGNMSTARNLGNRNVPPQNQFFNNEWNEKQNTGARPPIEDQWVARQNVSAEDDQWGATRQINISKGNDDQWSGRQNMPERNDDQWATRQNIPERNDDQWATRQNIPERNDDQWEARQNIPERNDDQWVARQNIRIGRGGTWQPQSTPNVPNRGFPIDPWKPNIRMQDNPNASFSHNNDPNRETRNQNMDDNNFKRGNQWESEQNNEPNTGPWNVRPQHKPELNRFNQGNNYQGNNFNFKGGQSGNDFAGNLPGDNIPNRNNQFNNNFRPQQRGRGGFRGNNRRGRGGRGHF